MKVNVGGRERFQVHTQFNNTLQIRMKQGTEWNLWSEQPGLTPHNLQLNQED